MNVYEWIWQGQTQKGKCIWGVVNETGEFYAGTEWNNAVETDIIEKTKATYYSTIVAEFIMQCEQQGITASLSSVDVQCEITKDPLKVESPIFIGSGQSGTRYTQRFIVKVKGTVVFESEEDLMASPIAPVLLIVLAKCIALIILAMGVSYGIYTFLNNMSLNETSSTITKTTTITNPSDEDVEITLPDGSTVTIPAGGTYTYETTETASTKGDAMASWIGLAAIVITAIFLLLIFTMGMPKRRD